MARKTKHKSDVRWHVWFLILFLISFTIGVYALRQNNLEMVRLRAAVYVADKRGVGVEKSLDDLRRYVHAHMNTNLSSGSNAIKPPIQLKYTYERLQAIEQKKAEAANSRIYTDAQHYCEQQNSAPFSGRSRVPCVEQYVSSHGVKAKPVPPSLYQFDFVSPTWSPDLAGWSLLLSLVFLIGATATYFRQWLARQRYSDLS